MTSDAKKRANMKYDAKTYEQIKIKERKEFQLNARLSAAAESMKLSKNAYMISAIEKQLEADGFGRANLTDEREPG